MRVCVNDGFRVAGPRGNFGPGEVFEVPEAEGGMMVAAGSVVAVDGMPAFVRPEEGTGEGVATESTENTEKGERDLRDVRDLKDVRDQKDEKDSGEEKDSGAVKPGPVRKGKKERAESREARGRETAVDA